jgi:isopenicillin N synthase-like dioxygenase
MLRDLLPTTTLMAPAIPKSPDSRSAAAPPTDLRDIDIDIPVFDLSHIQSEGLAGEGLDQVYEELRRCCEDWGCFRITNHGIPDPLIGSVEILSRDVFKLPRETKEKKVSPLFGGRYIKGGSAIPFYESTGLGPDFGAINEFHDLMWPHGNKNFCEVTREFFERMKELSDRVHKIILASLGVSNHYASHFDHCQFWLRMNEYQASCDEASGSIALPPHTDGSSITILHEDEVGGLQVLSKARNWVEVKPTRNSFIVFLGDTLQAWSNNRICSAKHRVIVKGRQSRLSLAFFRLFPDEMEINAPPELVDNEHPRRYKAFYQPEYRTFRLTKGAEWENHLEAYAANVDASLNPFL